MFDENNVKNHVYKIIIGGPVGAGKTEAVRNLSDKGLVTTEESASDDVKNLKATTTVAMDYGVMKLESGEQIRIYGTPGQRRFDFMWEILSENALGLVLLINASDEPLDNLDYYLNTFMPLIQSSTLVVGLTHCEDAPWNLHQQVTDFLLARNVVANVLLVDARKREDMRKMVHSMVLMISS